VDSVREKRRIQSNCCEERGGSLGDPISTRDSFRRRRDVLSPKHKKKHEKYYSLKKGGGKKGVQRLAGCGNSQEEEGGSLEGKRRGRKIIATMRGKKEGKSVREALQRLLRRGKGKKRWGSDVQTSFLLPFKKGGEEVGYTCAIGKKNGGSLGEMGEGKRTSLSPLFRDG